MKTDKVYTAMGKILGVLDGEDFRIDEKIAACRSAADFYQQVMTTESTVVMMRELIKQTFKNLDK